MSEIASIIRIGTISSINPGNYKARVIFEDKDNLVSQELYILNKGTKNPKEYIMPEVGEEVLCIFLPNGLEEGFIIGTYYNNEEKPVENDKNVFSMTFPDGAKFKYDLSSNSLILDNLKSLNIISQEVKINGKLTVSEGVFSPNIK